MNKKEKQYQEALDQAKRSFTKLEQGYLQEAKKT